MFITMHLIGLHSSLQVYFQGICPPLILKRGQYISTHCLPPSLNGGAGQMAKMCKNVIDIFFDGGKYVEKT